MGSKTAPIHKNRTTTMGRISGFISKDNLFKNVNLSSQLYKDSHSIVSTIRHWALPHGNIGESGFWKNYTFLQCKEFVDTVGEPVTIGQRFGPTWSTHWFKVICEIPAEWAGEEVHLRWSSSSEAAVWDEEGNVLQGISPGYREEFILTKNYVPGAPRVLYIEMSCNGMFGAGEGSDIAPTNNMKTFPMERAELASFNRQIFKIYTDIEMLNGIASQLSTDHRGFQAMHTANEMINLIRAGDYQEASDIADVYFSEGNGKKAHTLVAMGHCHIDTAWLWPYDETIRKCARSFTAQMGLMEEYPDYIFTCSQAQQYQWMKDYYPDVYAKIKEYVIKGQFVPVGGTWIEMDGNIPSGEAFMRQFFYGQRFYQEEFGITCKEFWLPDTFGYSAQIPQMIKHVGIHRFMTQKMSWSIVNKFPNHNFWWEGIDGTQVIVHFPPGDSYNMNATIQEMLYSMNNSQDKGRSNVGIYLFGFGDGGGGPTRTMIERQLRVKDVDGIPKVVMGTPDFFFEEQEKESGKFSKWVGELYLELHNGTYTSQALIKWYNRKCEFFFREVELLMAMAFSKDMAPDMAEDMNKLDLAWKDFLLNQFHDVLPGSCIELVAKDAWKIYEEIFAILIDLRKRYNAILLGAGTTNRVVYNPLPWDVKTVIFSKPDEGDPPTGSNIQAVTMETGVIDGDGEGLFRVPNNFAAALVEMKPSGFSPYTPIVPTSPVTYTDGATTAEYKNSNVRVVVEKTNYPTEEIYFTGPSGTEHKVFGDRHETGIKGGMFYIYDDIPLFWDAWDAMDYHLETQKMPKYTQQEIVQHFAPGPIVGGYKWTATFGRGSVITRYTIIRADSPMVEYYTIVDWKEEHQFLKVEFPVDILSREATFEIQYGNAKRPTHMNTSWDMAKFEVCGHKWMDISQADKGVTVITDSKYGWCVRDNIVKLSLLRSPKNPDPNCDIHKHFIYYAVLPHEGTFQESDIIRRAYELNTLGSNNIPLLYTNLAGVDLPTDWVKTSNSCVIVEAFKVAHDLAIRAVCVRLYESFGGKATTKVQLGFGVTKVTECNGLENPETDVPSTGNEFEASFTPFQIRSFLVYF